MGRTDRKASGLEVQATDTYRKVRLKAITIVERPKEGEKKLFFNPRSLASLNDDDMVTLRRSIQIDGLQTPLSVRIVTDKEDTVTRIDLIAGERRDRNLLYLVEEDAPCFDKHAPKLKDYKDGAWVIHESRLAKVVKHLEGNLVLEYDDGTTGEAEASLLCPTVPASKLYEWVDVQPHYNISDERCLRLACTENQKFKSFTVAEEISLVERLDGMGYKQDEICKLTGQNVTWVSQTSNFRTELPQAAFEKLLAGKLKRNVAVKLMSFLAADREKLFHQAEAEEEQETAETLRDLQIEQEADEDEAELAADEKEEALEAGDTEAAAKAEKREDAAETRAAKTAEKKKTVAKKAGSIGQGHVDKAAKKTGIQPRKAKMLAKADVEESWVNQLEQWSTVAETDPVTKEAYPKDLCRYGMSVAQAILNGSRDPGAVIRDFLVSKGKWHLPDATADDDDDVGEVTAESLGGKKKKKQPVTVADE